MIFSLDHTLPCQKFPWEILDFTQTPPCWEIFPSYTLWLIMRASLIIDQNTVWLNIILFIWESIQSYAQSDTNIAAVMVTNKTPCLFLNCCMQKICWLIFHPLCVVHDQAWSQDLIRLWTARLLLGNSGT